MDRAAHDGELPDAAHDPGRVPQRQGKVGERPDGQKIDAFASRRGLAERRHQEADGIGARDLGCPGRARGAAQSILAMDVLGMDEVLDDRLGGALVNRDVGPDHGERGEHVAGRRIELDVAEHRGDGGRGAAVGDQQQQRLGIVDAAVGVEDQPVGHSCG